MVYVDTGTNVHVTGRRVVAVVIDGIVFGVLISLLSAFGLKTSASGFNLTTLSGGGRIVLVVLALAYYTIMEGLIGQTVGKMVTGIRVLDPNTGRPPGLLKALFRTLMRIIDALPFSYLLGFIVVLASSRRRRLGDMVAGTQVVRG